MPFHRHTSRQTLRARLLALAAIFFLLMATSVADACAAAAGSMAASGTTHCGDCPDDSGDGPGKGCSGSSLCVFAGAALIQSPVLNMPGVDAPSMHIPSRDLPVYSVYLLPPNPPPIAL